MKNPERSEGARRERKAMRDYLRRKMKNNSDNRWLQEVLDWVLSRQKRYDAKPGGLGK